MKFRKKKFIIITTQEKGFHINKLKICGAISLCCVLCSVILELQKVLYYISLTEFLSIHLRILHTMYLFYNFLDKPKKINPRSRKLFFFSSVPLYHLSLNTSLMQVKLLIQSPNLTYPSPLPNSSKNFRASRAAESRANSDDIPLPWKIRGGLDRMVTRLKYSLLVPQKTQNDVKI